MSGRRARRQAYTELLSGLVDLGPTAAQEHYDALLTQAVAEGRLDEATARTLRWWQRESVRATTDHLLATAPGLLADLDEVHDRAREEVTAAGASWAAAQPDDAAASLPTPPPAQPAAAPTPQTESASAWASAVPVPVLPPAEGARPAGSGRHRDSSPAAQESTPLFDTVLGRLGPPGDVVPPAPRVVDVTDAAVAPERIDVGDEPVPLDDVPAPLTSVPARRRRLLVAGLTVKDDPQDRTGTDGPH